MLMITNIAQPITRVAAIGLLTLAISASVAAQQKPKTSYGLLLDSTGSMRSQFQTVLDVGKGIVHDAAPHGLISIFSFASEGIGKGSKAVPVLQIQQSQDEARLNRTIDGLYIEGGADDAPRCDSVHLGSLAGMGRTAAGSSS